MTSWWMVVGLVASMVSIADAGEAVHPLVIDLQMKNDARVPAQVLERSQAEVTRIFADAGITVRWTETTSRLTVNIVGQVLGYSRAGSPVMGVATRRPDGSTARIFLKQVQDFARAYHVELETMLAYVIAHELGHLLLAGYPHSETGVMQAEWDKALAEGSAKGSLTFTGMQAARMRTYR